MNEAAAWRHVEKRYNILAEHLRRRFAPVNADAAAERAALEQSAHALAKAVEDLVTSVDKTLHDRRLHRDVTALLTAVRQALLSSVQAARPQVERPHVRNSADERAASTRTR